MIICMPVRLNCSVNNISKSIYNLVPSDLFSLFHILFSQRTSFLHFLFLFSFLYFFFFFFLLFYYYLVLRYGYGTGSRNREQGRNRFKTWVPGTRIILGKGYFYLYYYTQ